MSLQVDHQPETTFDDANASFWDEPCGSSFAKAHGISDLSMASLAAFDRAYLDCYPYLLKRIGIKTVKGNDVLEVGLGYGTLSQQLAMTGARYLGLDVAAGPVHMVNHRLHVLGLPATAVQGSMLNAPVRDESQDVVISVGCFHHTGDMQRCIDETHRVLRPGGSARIMVYNALSYRQWLRWPRETMRLLWAGEAIAPGVDAERRRAYDANLAGVAAPETAFKSEQQLRNMFAAFSSFSCRRENCSDFTIFSRRIVTRRHLLSTVGRYAGLDLYITATK